MMRFDTRDRGLQRNFGFTMAGALCLLGFLHVWRAGGVVWLWFGAAGVFLLLGLTVPGVLRPILIVWLKLAEKLNAIVTHVLLAMVFFCMIVPGRAMVWLVGFDPLKRKWEPEAETYWEEPEEQPAELERYLNHF